jgi:hypothetical protein
MAVVRRLRPKLWYVFFEKRPFLETMDDVLIGDVGDGGARLKETSCVGPQGFVHLLLHLG